MVNYFSHILVPVDFSGNSTIAIAKALEITAGRKAHLHLLHVQQIRITGMLRQLHHSLSGYSMHKVVEDSKCSEAKLQALKSELENEHKDNVISCSVIFGQPVEEAIAAVARKLRVDLVVIGKHSAHYVLPFLNTVIPSRIAAASGIPVLSVKPGSLNCGIKTVVIPVGNTFPAKKLEMLEALRRNSIVKIKLVSFLTDEKNRSYSRQPLLSAFRTLKSQPGYPIDCEVLKGKNKAKSLLQYCQQVGADILIAYPHSETRAGGWIRRYISDFIPANSKTQVLTVQQS